MAYIVKGHLNKTRKWLFTFIIERYNTMLINYILFHAYIWDTIFLTGPSF